MPANQLQTPWRWDQRDLMALLCLEPAGERGFRSYASDVNANGRVYGGQLLGQSLWAAGQTSSGRSPSMLQLTFLQGARPELPIDFSVDPLQDGRRISTRYICGVQGIGMVSSANASFQQLDSGPAGFSTLDRLPADPEGLPTLAELSAAMPDSNAGAQLYVAERAALDVRVIEPERLTQTGGSREIAYWMKLTQPLPDDAHLHHAALAYMSDGWLIPGLVPGVSMLELWRDYYVSNLNHTLWFHHYEPDVNDWLLFVSSTVPSPAERGLATTRVYDRSGRLVASTAQDLLITARQDLLSNP